MATLQFFSKELRANIDRAAKNAIDEVNKRKITPPRTRYRSSMGLIRAASDTSLPLYTATRL